VDTFQDLRNQLKSIESFDTKTQEWSIIQPPLSIGLFGHTSCSIRGSIVVFGGHNRTNNGTNRSKQVTVMNRQQNNKQSENNWIINSEMSCDHHHSSIVVVDSKIIILGGYKSNIVESSNY